MLDFFFFFFNDTATTEIYTLSLHDALPIYALREAFHGPHAIPLTASSVMGVLSLIVWSLILIVTVRSEEHTSELQSLRHLVCRLLLEKKNTDGLSEQRSPHHLCLYLHGRLD